MKGTPGNPDRRLRSGSTPTPVSCAPCAPGATPACGSLTNRRRRRRSPPRATCKPSPTRASPARIGWWLWTTIWPAGGQLAVVQDPGKGGLLSGGILDMIAVKHTPVRPIPRQQLSAEALAGATMAVNVAGAALSPEQKEILRAFTRGGGTLLTGPPGWKDPTAVAGSITLEKAELERLNDIWRDVNSMIGRRNMGVRLFNVSSMLSNFLAAPGGKTAIVHLVNYSDYPVENVAMHFTGDYKHAVLTSPEGSGRPLEVYPTEDGGGVDI